jgi:hypothetical protein
MSLAWINEILQWAEHRKVVLEMIIALQNCVLIYDVLFKREAVPWGKLLFLGSCLLVLLAIVFLNYKTTARAKLADQQNDDLQGRIVKLASDLAHFLKEQSPEPARHSNERAGHNRKMNDLYLARYAPRISTIRHEIMAHEGNTPDLNSLVDNPFHDHEIVYKLAVKLSELASRMKIDELIKAA